MTDLRLRRLADADLPDLARDLAALPLLVRYRRSAEGLAASLAAARARGEGLLGVEESGGGLPLGLAWFTRAGTLGAGGYLRLLAVRPGHERRGAGAVLLAGFEREVSAESSHAFALVSDFNRDAQRFYARHGYTAAGRLPGFVLPEVDEILYWKRLERRPGAGSGA